MIYTYRCEICDHAQEAVRSIANRHDSPVCDECAGAMKLILTPIEFNATFLGSAANPGYMCPVSDEWIDSKRKRIATMDKHDMQEKE